MPEFRFSSLADFWHMSGHGPYVWACVAIALLILGFLLWHPLMLRRAALKKIARGLALEHSSTAPNPSTTNPE